METIEIIIAVVGAVSVLFMLATMWHQKKRLDIATFLENFEEMQQATVTARDFVLAAEQLWESGQLPGEDRYATVYAQMRVWFPNIDEDTLELLIEAAVRGMKIIAPRVETIMIDIAEELDGFGDDDGSP